MTDRLTKIQSAHGALSDEALLEAMIKDEFKGKIALISSFGADSALLIEMVAKIDPNTPILFLETGKHFQETLDYVDLLEKQFGLTNLRRLTPREDLLEKTDPNGDLWQTQVNRCCWLRKVEPLNRALDSGEFEAVITGRKSHQTAARSEMENIELFNDGIFRINPMINWTKDDIRAEFDKRELPQHPLVAQGYPSIGCAPCTRPVAEGEDERAGRWAHTLTEEDKKKEECGIHVQSSNIQETDWSV